MEDIESKYTTSLTELFDTISKKIICCSDGKFKKLDSFIDDIKKYIGTDWQDHIMDTKICYNKKLICRNEHIEMYVISWSQKCESHVHDHPDNGCIVRIMKGSVEEHIYRRLTQDNLIAEFTGVINILNEKNNVGFREGKTILHKIKNIDDDVSVSIHIYSKPEYVHNKYIINN